MRKERSLNKIDFENLIKSHLKLKKNFQALHKGDFYKAATIEELKKIVAEIEEKAV